MTEAAGRETLKSDPRCRSVVGTSSDGVVGSWLQGFLYPNLGAVRFYWWELGWGLRKEPHRQPCAAGIRVTAGT